MAKSKSNPPAKRSYSIELLSVFLLFFIFSFSSSLSSRLEKFISFNWFYRHPSAQNNYYASQFEQQHRSATIQKDFVNNIHPKFQNVFRIKNQAVVKDRTDHIEIFIDSPPDLSKIDLISDIYRKNRISGKRLHPTHSFEPLKSKDYVNYFKLKTDAPIPQEVLDSDWPCMQLQTTLEHYPEYTETTTNLQAISVVEPGPLTIAFSLNSVFNPPEVSLTLNLELKLTLGLCQLKADVLQHQVENGKIFIGELFQSFTPLHLAQHPERSFQLSSHITFMYLVETEYNYIKGQFMLPDKSEIPILLSRTNKNLPPSFPWKKFETFSTDYFSFCDRFYLEYTVPSSSRSLSPSHSVEISPQLSQDKLSEIFTSENLFQCNLELLKVLKTFQPFESKKIISTQAHSSGENLVLTNKLHILPFLLVNEKYKFSLLILGQEYDVTTYFRESYQKFLQARTQELQTKQSSRSPPASPSELVLQDLYESLIRLLQKYLPLKDCFLSTKDPAHCLPAATSVSLPYQNKHELEVLLSTFSDELFSMQFESILTINNFWQSQSRGQPIVAVLRLDIFDQNHFNLLSFSETIVVA